MVQNCCTRAHALIVDQLQIYLQSLALGLFFVGLVLTLHNRFRTTEQLQQDVALDRVEDITQPDEQAMAPLPEGGLPPGWTIEQWKWYGHEYLEDSK